jgi:hypothetical protein
MYPILTEAHKDQMFYELKEDENHNYHSLDQFMATNSTILKVNVFNGSIYSWMTFRDHSFSNFHDKLADLEDRKDQIFRKRLYE